MLLGPDRLLERLRLLGGGEPALGFQGDHVVQEEDLVGGGQLNVLGQVGVLRVVGGPLASVHAATREDIVGAAVHGGGRVGVHGWGGVGAAVV
jgi:hypothetical protein